MDNYEVGRLEFVVEATVKNTMGKIDALIAKLSKLKIPLKAMSDFATKAVEKSNSKKTGNEIDKTNSKLSTTNNKLKFTTEQIETLNAKLKETKMYRQLKALNPDASEKQLIAGVQAYNAQLQRLQQLQNSVNYRELDSANINKDILRLKRKIGKTNEYQALALKNPKLTEKEILDLLKKQVTETKSLNTLNKNLNERLVKNRSLIGTIRKATLKLYGVIMAIRTLWKSVRLEMDYEETKNYFQVAFRGIGKISGEEFADSFMNEMQDFTDRLSNKLSLDPNETMDYAASFGQLGKSMGLTAQTATNITKAFLMLGMDITSLTNGLGTGSEKVEQAMNILKSGLTGLPKGLKRIGVDITQDSLEAVAFAHGITQSVATMNSAQKAQLRFLKIMQSTTDFWGDMARTLDSPANQFRILRVQVVNLGRSIGKVLIPIFNKLLPILNAVVIATKDLVLEFATFIGYEEPDFSETGLYLGDLADEAEDTTEAINNLKTSMLGLDELNTLGSNTGDKNTGQGFAILDDEIAEQTKKYVKNITSIEKTIVKLFKRYKS